MKQYTQYKLVCPECRIEFTSFSKEGTTCSRCSTPLVYTGYTDQEFKAKTAEERKAIIQEICDGEQDALSQPQSVPGKLFLTTGTTVEGYTIRSYLGIVSATKRVALSIGKDLVSTAIQSAMMEGELDKLRSSALRTLQQNAAAIGANAVIGVSIDIVPVATFGQVLQQGISYIICNINGTAVIVE